MTAYNYKVVASYQAAYPDPICVRAGDALIVGEEDPEYPGWVWCEGPDGRLGWVPVDCIENVDGVAGAKYDYKAVELTATEGERLVLVTEKNGWALCTNENGKTGWLPIANLEKAL